MTLAGWHLDAALVAALAGALLGLLVPRAIGWLPEPPARADVPADGDAATGETAAAEERPPTGPLAGPPAGPTGPLTGPPTGPTGQPAGRVTGLETQPATGRPGGPRAADKELYADLARLPGLGWRCAVASGLVAGLLGARLGWSPALLFLIYLAPVGVALSVVDWRTRLLPRLIVLPSVVVVALLGAAAGWLDGGLGPVLGMLAGGVGGWLVFELIYWVGRALQGAFGADALGAGDVRLAVLLGLALGWFGLAEWAIGLYSGFLLGALVGSVLSLLRVVDRRGYPFGPFMLAGALLGVLAGPYVAAWYA